MIFKIYRTFIIYLGVFFLFLCVYLPIYPSKGNFEIKLELREKLPRNFIDGYLYQGSKMV
jgi:hypothetical protein